MKAQHFHPFYGLRFFRKWLFLGLFPMLRALLRFDWDSFMLALRQDFWLLLGLLLVSFILWQAGSWQLNSDLLTLNFGVIARGQQSIRRTELASVVLVRPLSYRLFGASRLTLYMQRSQPARLTLYLPRRDAEALARALMPVDSSSPVFEPVGFERLSLVMLSANITLAGVFAVYSARRTLLDFDPNLTETAWRQLQMAEAQLGRFLPTGLAWLVTLGFCIYTIALFYSLLCKARLRVFRGRTVLVARYGLLTLTERRVRLSAVTACEVRITPAARLLRRYPVYLSAGYDTGSEAPLFLCRKNDWLSLRRLMPGFHLPPRRSEDLPGRSLVAYFWFSGGGFVVCALLALLTHLYLPAYRFLFLAALPFFLFMFLQSVEGFFREGVGRSKNSLTLCYTRWFSRHEVCVFTRRTALTYWQNPFNSRQGRGNLLLRLPALWYSVRSVTNRTAHELPL